MNYRIRFHPLVARDLDAIAHWILDYVGPDAAARKLAEIEAVLATLKATPHKGSLRDLPPGRPSVITRVLRVDSCRFGLGQARRARSPQIAQALGALQRVFCCPAMSVA